MKSQGITDTSDYNLYGSMYQGSIYKIDFGKGGHIITSCALVELYDFLKLDYSKSCCPCGLMPNPFYISDVKGYEIKRV